MNLPDWMFVLAAVLFVYVVGSAFACLFGSMYRRFRVGTWQRKLAGYFYIRGGLF